MNRTTSIVIGSIVIIALIVGAFFGMKMMTAHPATAHTVTVEKHDVVQSIATTGPVQAKDTYPLSFGTSGIIKTVQVKKGDHVIAGQVLATIDASDIAMQRASATASLVGDQAMAHVNSEKTAQAQKETIRVNAANIAAANQKVKDTKAYVDTAQGIFTDVSNDDDIDTTSITYITAAQTLVTARSNYAEAQAALKSAQASAAQSNAAAYNDARVAQQALVLKQNVIDSLGTLSVNQAQVGYQNALLSKTVLRAPVAGVLASVDMHAGQFASPTASSATLLGSSLEIATSVSEADIAQLHVGQAAQVTIDALGSEPFDATVTSIDPAATMHDGVSSYGITLNFLKQDSRIISGMTANSMIPVAEKKDVVAVPSDAVFADRDTFFVNTIDAQGKAHKQQVQLGIRGTNGYDEIVSGLTNGQSILSFSTK